MMAPDRRRHGDRRAEPTDLTTVAVVADAPSPANDDRPPSRRTGLTLGSAFVVVGAVVVAFVMRDAFVAAHRIVGWVVACAVVALLIDPLVDALERHLPRLLSVVVVLLGALAVVGAVAYGVINDVTDSLDELRREAPRAATELEERYDWAAEIGITDRVEDFVDDLGERIRGGAVSRVADTVPTYLVTGILMLFLLGYGRRYVDGFLAQLGDDRRRRVSAVLSAMASRGRIYLLVVVVHSLVNGFVVWLTCTTLDLPAAGSLGVAAGAFTFLPLIGILLGAVPALLLAFGLEGWRTGLVVLAVVVALQAVEAGFVRPRVDPATVRVGPTIPIVVGLLGFELYGAGGAVYAVALAVLGLAALDEIGRQLGEQPAVDEPTVDLSDLRSVPAP